MMLSFRFQGMILALVAGLALTGCGREGAKQKEPAKSKSNESAKAKEGHKHGSEWCDPHGVPEENCSLCLTPAQVKIRFKDKGDWCKSHERAKSQCFKCDPQLYASFEASYAARHGGKKPPRPPQSEFE